MYRRLSGKSGTRECRVDAIRLARLDKVEIAQQNAGHEKHNPPRKAGHAQGPAAHIGQTINNLPRIREAMGVTGAELARQIGVSRTAVYHWQSGKAVMLPKQALAVCQLARSRGLNWVTLEHIYGLTPLPSPPN